LIGNSLVPCSTSGFGVILQTIGQLLGEDEHDYCAFSALGIPDGKLLVIHIKGSEIQNFAYPHATLVHELQHKAVSHLGDPEDNLVNNFFLADLLLSQLSWSEKLFQHGGAARILELRIQIIRNEVKEGFEVGVTGVLSDLCTSVVEAGEKGKNLL